MYIYIHTYIHKRGQEYAGGHGPGNHLIGLVTSYFLIHISTYLSIYIYIYVCVCVFINNSEKVRSHEFCCEKKRTPVGTVQETIPLGW